MPNRHVHVVTSGAVGALYALHRSGAQPEVQRFCELLGGIAGGYVGGCAPDVLDPPTTPRHRGRAHSMAVATGVLKLTETELSRWQQTCRGWADEIALKRAACPLDTPLSVVLALAEMVCRMLAGFLAGLLAGYATHLALDACTPYCITLV